MAVVLLEGRKKVAKKRPTPTIYCKKTGLTCAYSAGCKWLSSVNATIDTCKNQEKNLVAMQLVEYEEYGI